VDSLELSAVIWATILAAALRPLCLKFAMRFMAEPSASAAFVFTLVPPKITFHPGTACRQKAMRCRRLTSFRSNPESKTFFLSAKVNISSLVKTWCFELPEAENVAT
jgi:hypothetical protein